MTKSIETLKMIAPYALGIFGVLAVFLINFGVRQDYYDNGGFVYFDSVSYIAGANSTADRIEDIGLFPWIGQRFQQVSALPEIFSALFFPSALRSAYPFMPLTLVAMATFGFSIAVRAKLSNAPNIGVLCLILLLMISPFALAIYGGASDTWLESPTLWFIGAALLLLISALKSLSIRLAFAGGTILACAALSRETAVVLTSPVFILVFLFTVAGQVHGAIKNRTVRSDAIAYLKLGAAFVGPMVIAILLMLTFQLDALIARAVRNIGVDLMTDQSRIPKYIFHPRILETGILLVVASLFSLTAFAVARLLYKYFHDGQKSSSESALFGSSINFIAFLSISIIAFNIALYKFGIAYHSINLFNYLFILILVLEVMVLLMQKFKIAALTLFGFSYLAHASEAPKFYKDDNNFLIHAFSERRQLYDEIAAVVVTEAPSMIAIYFESGGPQWDVYSNHIRADAYDIPQAPVLKQHGRVLRVSRPEFSNQDWFDFYAEAVQKPNSLVFTYCTPDDVEKSLASELWTDLDKDVVEAILFGLTDMVSHEDWRRVAELPVLRQNEIGGQVCAFKKKEPS